MIKKIARDHACLVLPSLYDIPSNIEKNPTTLYGITRYERELNSCGTLTRYATR